MSLGAILSSLVIGPLKMLFELIFSLINRFGSAGISIVGLSLCMNLLVLPLYRRADAIQEEEREMEARLAPGVAHIKKTFQGDQRFMTLQTYYRQNHYSQAHALKGLLPLMLEIPFFIAAYQFLSGLQILKGASFGPIRDLGAPDTLLSIGGITINLMPVLMTMINIISGSIYHRGGPLKSKIQLYAMAMVFLVLLYRSPAGLTMYWTLNNLFSLVKNCIIRIASGSKQRHSRRMPAVLDRDASPAMFFLTAALLAVLTGGLIPSAVIASSPSEFVDAGAILHPFWYIVSSLLLSAGSFVLWPGIYYLLGNRHMKKGLEIAAWIMTGCMIVNYMCFHADFGILSSVLQFENLPMFSWNQKLINLGVLAAVGLVFCLIYFWRKKFCRGVCAVVLAAMTVMTGYNMVQAQPVIRDAIAAVESGSEEKANIPLSRTGKNVVVMMLDRAISSYIPAIFAEKSELENSFDGFTYYPNTLSHGAYTNFGTPGLFGGYEYTPWEMNQRTEEPLSQKHDEALLMMPTLFSREGAKVTVIDPPYAGSYAFIPDLSIYSGMENVKAYRAVGAFSYQGTSAGKQSLRFRNFFSYALCQTFPRLVYGTLYNCGYYNDSNVTLSLQSLTGVSLSRGSDADFIMNYDVMTHLPEMTEIQEDGDTLLVMNNEITHNPQLLQTPDYTPAYHVDNREYDAEHTERFSAGEMTLKVDTEDQMRHYHVNMAAMIQLGKWLDYLKANHLYDNTRIILVSDHGRNLGTMKGRNLPDGTDLLYFNALLMVKDFDSHGSLETDGTFMTNADVPTLASEGMIDNPENPFTGKAIDGEAEKEQPQKVTVSMKWDTGSNNGNTFSRSAWYLVQDEVLNPQDWTYYGEY